MATLVCDRCGRVTEADGAHRTSDAKTIKCSCGGRMLRRSESEQNEMRDMDNELGRDE